MDKILKELSDSLILDQMKTMRNFYTDALWLDDEVRVSPGSTFVLPETEAFPAAFAELVAELEVEAPIVARAVAQFLVRTKAEYGSLISCLEAV